MRTLAAVDLSKANHPEVAQTMEAALRGIELARGVDTAEAVRLIAETSGYTLRTILECRSGWRDPKTSAPAISRAIESLGGPVIAFPSERKRQVATPPAPPPASPVPAAAQEPPKPTLEIQVPAGTQFIRVTFA